MTRSLRRLLVPILAVAVALAAGGCGTSTGAGADADPAKAAPQTSFVYGEVTIDPSGSQESAMRSILADLPGTGAPQDRIENLIREAIRKDKSTKVDWDKDVKPWLGNRAGVFVGPPASGKVTRSGRDLPYAVIVPTTDSDAARDAIEKDKSPGSKHESYRGVGYVVENDGGDMTSEGVVGGYLITGSDAGMRALIDASKDGKTLADTDRFKQARQRVPAEHVGFVYVDLRSALQFASAAAGNAFPGGALLGGLLGAKPIVIVARAEQQALVFEGAGGFPSSGLVHATGDPRPIMESLPRGSWAALAAPGLGQGLKAFATGIAGAVGGLDMLRTQLRGATGLDLDKDLLSWIGDAGVFVDGDSKATLGGGAVISSRDPKASKLALTKIAAAIARTDPSTKVAAAHVAGAFGYELKPSDTPRPLLMVQKGDKVALTYGEPEAKAALSGDGLGGSAAYKRAATGLGSGYSPSLYVSAPPILRVAESFGASGSNWDQARPYLTILDYLIAGGTHGGTKNARVRLGFKPHE